jgi:uncharacterized spore protein YtfJ
MPTTTESTPAIVEQMREQNEKIVDKIYAAAEPGVVFSAPVVSGEYTVITASEVMGFGGFGFGTGSGPTRAQSSPTDNGREPQASDSPDVASGAGGGGGGGSVGRPVAAIVIGPNGVKVEPIVDVTKLALAGITTWGSIAFMIMRMVRRR